MLKQTYSSIEITKVEKTRINDVDFDNLSFGKIFSDHMLICTYKNGAWNAPKIVPYQSLTLDPSTKIFHYGQAIFEGLTYNELPSCLGIQSLSICNKVFKPSIK